MNGKENPEEGLVVVPVVAGQRPDGGRNCSCLLGKPDRLGRLRAKVQNLMSVYCRARFVD